MGRTQVSAQTLTETFLRRLGAMFPNVRVEGFEVTSLGGGKWQPKFRFASLPDPILADAYALISEMQAQFDVIDSLGV